VGIISSYSNKIFRT